MLIDSKAAKNAREACGLTQEELAKKASVSRFTVQGYEAGRRRGARMRTLRKVAGALDVTVADIAKAETDGEQQFLEREREASDA